MLSNLQPRPRYFFLDFLERRRPSLVPYENRAYIRLLSENYYRRLLLIEIVGKELLKNEIKIDRYSIFDYGERLEGIRVELKKKRMGPAIDAMHETLAARIPSK